jgi:hypothetical protein
VTRWAAAAALFFAFGAWAQPAAVVLVAKPELADPNFSESVVLVTHAPGGETLGVILNRPTHVRLADLAPGAARQVSSRRRSRAAAGTCCRRAKTCYSAKIRRTCGASCSRTRAAGAPGPRDILER